MLRPRPPTCAARCAGAFGRAIDGLASRTYLTRQGPLAQWLEPTAHNGLVAGSSPAGPTTYRPSLQVRLILTSVKTWNGVILRRSTTCISPRASAQSEIRANGNSGRRPSGRATFASPSSSFAARPRSE